MRYTNPGMQLSTSSLSFKLSRVQIRQVTQGDLYALEWDGEYTHFRRLFSEAYRQARRDQAVLWVAEFSGVGLIGQVFVQLNSQRKELADGHSRAYLYAFRVRSPYQGHGLGTHLLEYAETDLRRRGYHTTTLNVNRDNDSARRLYERMGYRIVAPEPGIWSYLDHNGRRMHVNEPAWRMEKNLVNGRYRQS